MGTMV
jgi:hypothetical protein